MFFFKYLKYNNMVNNICDNFKKVTSNEMQRFHFNTVFGPEYLKKRLSYNKNSHALLLGLLIALSKPHDRTQVTNCIIDFVYIKYHIYFTKCIINR